MKITKLTCPNCGAPINKKTTKCEYCGTSFVLENNISKNTEVTKKNIDLEFDRIYSLKSNYEVKANTKEKVINSGKPQKFIAILLASIIIASAFVGIMIGITRSIDNEYAEASRRSEFECPMCGSYDTYGYRTFWKNDGMLCSDKTNADYTIMRCDHCKYDWKHYL